MSLKLHHPICSFRPFLLAVLIMLALLFGACSSSEQPSSTPDATAANGTVSDGTPSGEAAGGVAYQAVDPLTAVRAVPPIHISIPDAGLDAAVEPMGWTVIEEGGQRTTQWLVPESAAGWHVNSAGAGAEGNMILSGHQVQGDAVFVPLSLGDVAVGQQVLVEDEEGVVFVYGIVDVSDPIAVASASAEEEATALAYVGPGQGALLTLITGWPDFTTTHRVFAQAELLGVQK